VSIREVRARWRRGVKKAVGTAASVAVVASSLVVAGAVTAAPASAADPFQCTPGSVYVQSETQVREFAVKLSGGTPTNGGSLVDGAIGQNPSTNAVGISSGGRHSYTVTNAAGSKTLAKHDRTTNTTSTSTFALNESVLRGAVHPITGVYYFATGTSNGSIKLFAWNETAKSAVQVGTLTPAAGSKAFGANGDMAFSASGQLLLVADNVIYSADVPEGTSPSTGTISAKEVFAMDSSVLGNGIAFGNLGHIFVSAGASGGNPNRIIEVDLARGTIISTTSLGSFSPTDMASCTFPNTLTLKKDLPEGRQAATDQFGLRIDAPTGYSVTQVTATTTGNASGLQPDYAGPIFTNQGDVFTLSESAAGTTDLSRYDASLQCEQVGTSAPVSVDGNTVTQPAGDLGTDVICTYTNAKLTPGLELHKTADPASGTSVVGGQTISYTVEAENTGNTTLDPVEIADDLSDVFAHAEYQDDIITEIDGTELASGAASITDDQLGWTGALEPGQIVTITYSVIVDDDVAGETIANRVTASGTPPGPFTPITPPAVTTEHPVAGFEITKTADPASGTVVAPGDTITYTISGANTGATALNPATIADDLSDVLAHADYNDDIVTRVDGSVVTSGTASITGDDLAWTGGLQAGQAVTITYSVTVGEDTSGEILRNTVTGSGTPTTPDPANPDGPEIPGTPIVPPAISTEHPVIGSGFTISKSANPASGTAVEAGDTVEYTIVGTNTGDTVLDPAEIEDDLSAVFDSASYNDDLDASRGDADIDGDTLSWSGSLAKGESVTITYSVTVNMGVTSALLHNIATGEGTPQIPNDPSDPDSPTTPGTPITPPPAETTHPVVDNGFEVTKSADPASGTAVQAGDTIEYTVTGTNTGNTVLDPASITDDLSAVLSSAKYNSDVSSTVGAAQVVGNTLSWTGALNPGDDVVITYTVTVDEDATGVLLHNIVEGEATPLIPEDPTDPESPTTPGEPVTPPPAETEHPVVNPGFEVAKTANPVTGTAVDPGSVIEYTVTGTNTGDTVLDPASITDNLTDVLAHASYNDDVKSSIGTASVSGGTLTWNGSLEPEAAVTITYSVTVDGDAGGETIRNSVTGSGTPQMPEDPSDPESSTTPGTPLVPPTVTTEHPVNEPGFAFGKSVDPASGTAVDPGAVLTYTLTGVNTGQTGLDTVEIADDLSGVLEFAEYNGDAVATINGQAAAAPSVAGETLSWSGSLDVGQTVVVTYSVTVGPDAAGEVLENSATGTATPPGGETITPPPGTTENPVNVPGFSVSKSASPAAGTAVDPGSVVTYTVTGVNTGETALDPASIVDDLSGVLEHAEYNGDAAATINGQDAAAPDVSDGSLSWTGGLAVGETVAITYSVTVNGDAGGTVLRNSVSGTATPPGGVPPIETPPAVTEHPVNEPGFEIAKTADPASGTRVDPGSVITYTVTGVNTGETALNSVSIVDDLSAVLENAVYNGDVAATLGDSPVVAEDSLSWTGALAVGERVTITYSVTVNGDAGGALLENTVSGVAVPPGEVELTPPPAETEHPVGKPGFTFEKTSDPASGTKVATGSVVTYTLTGVNTGETALDSVTITDDLGDVLRHAELKGAAVVKIGDREVAPAAIDGTELIWTGSLAEGETITITYAVTVNADAAGETLANVATASATPPGGETITTPPSSTEHPVLTPLAITGGQIAPWILALSVLLLICGGVLLVLRRRTETA
jgi:fimbrial isopeptide formation D2 family protein